MSKYKVGEVYKGFEYTGEVSLFIIKNIIGDTIYVNNIYSNYSWDHFIIGSSFDQRTSFIGDNINIVNILYGV